MPPCCPPARRCRTVARVSLSALTHVSGARLRVWSLLVSSRASRNVGLQRDAGPSAGVALDGRRHQMTPWETHSVARDHGLSASATVGLSCFLVPLLPVFSSSPPRGPRRASVAPVLRGVVCGECAGVVPRGRSRSFHSSLHTRTQNTRAYFGETKSQDSPAADSPSAVAPSMSLTPVRLRATPSRDPCRGGVPRVRSPHSAWGTEFLLLFF